MNNITSNLSLVNVSKDDVASYRLGIGRQLQASRYELDEALLIAWKVGCIFCLKEKSLGKKLWSFWANNNLSNDDRIIIYRYMKLSKKVKDPSLLPKISLRQAYIWLGVSMTPGVAKIEKSLPKLPDQVVYLRKIMLDIKKKR